MQGKADDWKRELLTHLKLIPDIKIAMNAASNRELKSITIGDKKINQPKKWLVLYNSLIDYLCKLPTEYLAIFRLKIAGCSNVYISDNVAMSTTSIHFTLAKIYTIALGLACQLGLIELDLIDADLDYSD